EDAELISATTTLESNTAWLKNMKDKAIGLLTKQIVDAAALIVKYDASMSSDENVIAAGNALADDQTIAKQLKLRLTKAIYEKCATDDPFNVLNEDILETEPDSINLDCYIQNANLYTLETSANRNLTDIKNLPGWSLNIIKGTPGIALGWSAWTASDTDPVNDQFLICGWNTEWNLFQTVTDLPVGKYRYVSGTQDRGFGDNCDDKKAALETQNHWTVAGNVNGETGIEGEIFSYIWWQVGEKKDSVAYDITNQGQWYDFTECNSKPFEIPVAGDTNMGEVTIGSYAKAFQSQAAADNFRLYMIGKAEGFDYAAAAKAIGDVITDVENVVVMPEGEPVKVTYYDLNGQMTTTPQGVTIKVYTYKNGAIKVVKTLVK
ncbi:MAG: hypothetical protein Q4D28_06770, partial [Prevotellaceae bacterium]|nr:hypothetical protein [Prevotellaceae bacterium]